jgi:endonuclease-3
MEKDSKKRAAAILKRLSKEYPEPLVELEYSTPFELLVASRLAAQNRDENINKITPALFRKYRGPKDYIAVDELELQQDIVRSGFFRQKAKALKEISQMLIDKHGGKVPDSLDDLVALPGIGRKTANVILSFAMGKAEGIVVDVHHIRVTARLGFTKQTNADKIEKEMIEIVPKKGWIMWSSAITLHGRRICTARKPKCSACVVNDLCPSAFKIEGAV